MRLSFKIKGRQIITFWLVACFILPSIVFAGTFAAFTGQINASGINVRVDATVGAEVICTLSKGELVEVDNNILKVSKSDNGNNVAAAKLLYEKAGEINTKENMQPVTVNFIAYTNGEILRPIQAVETVEEEKKIQIECPK